MREFAFLLPTSVPNPERFLWVIDQPNVVVVITAISRLNLNHLRQAMNAVEQLALSGVHIIALSQARCLPRWAPRLPHGVTNQSNQPPGGLPRNIVVLLWSTVMMYPLDHELVPMHRKATREERMALGPLSNLPLLRIDDPVAQYLALESGDVVHILRPDGSVYWRHIVGVGPTTTSG